MKPWLDIVTTGIPRLCTEKCIRSFIENFTDRNAFRLRWLFNLDSIPPLIPHAGANMRQAQNVTNLFDEVELNQSTRQGYGTTVHAQLTKCRNDVLWIEDDKFWLSPFSVLPLHSDGKPCFWKGRTKRPMPASTPFATAPGYWPQDYWRWILEHFPQRRQFVTEAALMGLCQIGGKIGLFVRDQGEPWQDVGLEHGKKLGYKLKRGSHWRCDAASARDDVPRGTIAFNRNHALSLCLEPGHVFFSLIRERMILEGWPPVRVAHAFTLLGILQEHFGERPLLGAEIGVNHGDCASRLLRRMPGLTLHLIDSWRSWPKSSSYGGTTDEVATYSDAEQVKVWKKAHSHVVGNHGATRARVWVADSVPMARRFLEQGIKLDFAFIDANHSYEGVAADVRAWWPLVKSGGLLAGHDYGPIRGHNFGEQVQRAVDEWAKEIGRTVEVFPHWVWVVRKPMAGELPSWCLE